MKFNRKNKNLLQRKYLKKTELFQKVLKTVLLYNQQKNLQLALKKTNPLNIGYKNSIKNYCIVSGRSRSVYRKFKVSRIYFRYLGSKGLFFGLRKAS